MSKVSNVVRLPSEFRAWLDRRLYEAGFSNYAAIAAEAKGMGHSVSKSALHRYGIKLRARVHEAEAKALITSGEKT